MPKSINSHRSAEAGPLEDVSRGFFGAVGVWMFTIIREVVESWLSKGRKKDQRDESDKDASYYSARF